MKNKHIITCFLCLMLLPAGMGGGCSKEAEVTADNSALAETDQSVQQEAVTKAAVTEAAKPSEQPSKETSASEDTSPWKLISNSSVDTAVFYAGFLNESLGVTVGYSGAISYTEDGGKSWSQSDNVSACRYGLDLYEDSLIISSGNLGVNLVSSNKGKSWNKLTDFPLKNSNYYNKFLSITDKKNIYVGSKVSLAVSADEGKSWEELKLPENCKEIMGMYFMTPEIGYLLGKDGTLVKTKDSGKTWTAQTIDLAGETIANTTMPSVAINFQDEDHGMIVYATPKYQLRGIKTEDGGDTWEAMEMPKGTCLAPYISRDGKYLTLSSLLKKICLYELEE